MNIFKRIKKFAGAEYIRKIDLEELATALKNGLMAFMCLNFINRTFVFLPLILAVCYFVLFLFNVFRANLVYWRLKW